MKKRWVLIISFISLLILTMGMVNGEERPIYIGDIIELNISSETHSVSDIELAFEDFEIVELIKEDDNYYIKLRSFEVGEHNIIIGNTQLVITVESLLVEDKGLIEADTNLEKTGVGLPWTYIKYFFLGLSIIGIVIFVVLIIKNKPAKPLSNYDYLIKQINMIPTDDKDYAYKLTSMFKVYLSKELNLSLVGLTSIELIASITSKDEVKDIISNIDIWLKKCDAFKYSKDKANESAKEGLKSELVSIVESVHRNREVTQS